MTAVAERPTIDHLDIEFLQLPVFSSELSPSQPADMPIAGYDEAHSPTKSITTDTLVWDHTVGPAGTIETVDLVGVTPEIAAEPKPGGFLKNKLSSIKSSWNNSWLGTRLKQVGELLATNRVEAISLGLGAVAAASAGYSLWKGTADLHTFDSFSTAAFNFLEIKRPSTPIAEMGANKHLLSAGLASAACIGATGAFAVKRHFTSQDARRTLPQGTPTLRAYSIERPPDFYTLSLEELRDRTVKAHVGAAMWRALARQNFARARSNTVYYAETYVAPPATPTRQPTLAEIFKVDTSELSIASLLQLSRFDNLLRGEHVPSPPQRDIIFA